MHVLVVEGLPAGRQARHVSQSQSYSSHAAGAPAARRPGAALHQHETSPTRSREHGHTQAWLFIAAVSCARSALELAPLDNLQTEPWLFVTDRNGDITSRLEGSFGFNAFQAAINTALR